MIGLMLKISGGWLVTILAGMPLFASMASREFANRLLPGRLPPKKSGLGEPVGMST